jgi:ATP-dependent DNA helicase RecG
MKKLKESQKLELKKSLAEVNEILETISAFANKQGGKILVGFEEEKDGSIKEVVGINVKGRVIENIANEIKQNTDPVLFPSIEVKKIKAKEILSIEIEESLHKPVFAKRNSFIRVGRTNRRLSSQEIRRMAKESGDYDFTGLVCKEAALADIDFVFVKDFFITKYQSMMSSKLSSVPEDLLRSLGALKNNQPTVAGILLFGKDMQRFFMNAYVAVARYKKGIGAERLDYKEFTGNIFQQIDQCDKYIKEHISIMSRQNPMEVEREDIPEYGLFSIRELITNAVSHRDYSEQRSKVIIKMFNDKLEFYNPGGLAKDINSKNIMRKQFSRNPLITKTLSKVKYIEELGEGWDKIIEEHKRHPLHPKLPKIEADESSVLITLFSTRAKFEGKKEKFFLNERQEYILETIRLKGFMRSRDIQKKFSITRDTANRDLKGLIDLKLIKKRGVGKSITYTEK